MTPGGRGEVHLVEVNELMRTRTVLIVILMRIVVNSMVSFFSGRALQGFAVSRMPAFLEAGLTDSRAARTVPGNDFGFA